jgi:SUMO ligase MMS21 Smc5/6 complex component
MSQMISDTHNGNCIAVTADDTTALDSVKLTEELREALQSVEDSIEELNAALRQAMEAGATVELRRRSRVHSGDGCWADQMATLVLPKSQH